MGVIHEIGVFLMSKTILVGHALVFSFSIIMSFLVITSVFNFGCHGKPFFSHYSSMDLRNISSPTLPNPQSLSIHTHTKE